MTWFDGHVISGIEGVAKPGEQIYRIFLQRSAAEAGEAVFIDDSPRNVAAARALGIHAVHYTDAGKLRHELRALGTPGA